MKKLGLIACLGLGHSCCPESPPAENSALSNGQDSVAFIAPTAPTVHGDRRDAWIARDRVKIEARAYEVLNDWMLENERSAEQIEGAQVVAIQQFGNWYYVEMLKDQETTYEDLRYFHVLLTTGSLKLAHLERGPDVIE